MKKILLSFLATATILVSCNKNDDTPNNPQQSSNLLKKIIEKDEEGKIGEVKWCKIASYTEVSEKF